MKTFFKILLLIIFVIVGYYFLVVKDDPTDFVAYQEYRAELQSFGTEYGTMRYRDEGQGKAILMVHGVPTNSWMYRNLADQLVADGYRVIVPDLMGFGASDVMDEYDDYDFENQADILISLMDSLGITRWQQVTHDMGGLVTWNMAKKAPQRIEQLFMLNTIIYKETFNPPADFSMDNSLHQWILQQHGHPLIGKLIVNNMIRTGTGDHSYTNSDRAGYWLPLRGQAGSLVHFFTHTKEIKENLDEYRSWLIDSNIPVMVIWGEDDPFLDVATTIFLRDDMDLDDEDILVLEGAKHLIAEESYLEIAAQINRINNK